LLAAAEREGFDLMITSWPRIQKKTDEVVAVVDGMSAGEYVEVRI
jgi:hypothetical protein